MQFFGEKQFRRLRVSRGAKKQRPRVLIAQLAVKMLGGFIRTSYSPSLFWSSSTARRRAEVSPMLRIMWSARFS